MMKKKRRKYFSLYDVETKVKQFTLQILHHFIQILYKSFFYLLIEIFDTKTSYIFSPVAPLESVLGSFFSREDHAHTHTLFRIRLLS